MMKTYERYKPSGIDWIGDIPDHWHVKKLKYNTYVKARVGWHGLKASEFSMDEGVYCVTGTDFSNGRINWEHCYRVSEKRYAEDPFIQLKEGDLLVTKDGTIGKLAVVKNLREKATLNSGLFVVRPDSPEYITDFMYWAFQSPIFYEFVNYTSKGSTIIHLYQDTFINLPFLLPTAKEQYAIAKYLDEKTVQIDKLIAGKQMLIELLKEERLGVINQAVTRGINPLAKFKPLGISWLGEIPEHWEVKKLKYVAEMQGGFAFNSSDYVPEGIQLIKIGNLYQNDFLLDRQPTFLPEHYLEEYKEWVIEYGDILISMTGTLGKRDYGYAIQNDKTDGMFLLNQRVSRIRFNENKLQKELGLHILRSNYYLDQLFLLPTGTKQGNLSTEQVLSISIIFPKSLSEQNQIVQFIEAETIKIDATVAKIEKEIEYLREYRIALISEVVTGKIKIV